MNSEKRKKLDEIIKYKKRTGNDNIQYKEIIKQKILGNSNIIHFLENTDLDEDCPDDYYCNGIYPFYLLTDTQDKTANYICYETSFNEEERYNGIMKLGQIIFYIVCDNKDIIEKETGIPRHDLLGALITDEFDWSNFFGTQIHLVSDRPNAIDGQYIGRTLIFEQTTPNAIIKNARVYNNGK